MTPDPHDPAPPTEEVPWRVLLLGCEKACARQIMRTFAAVPPAAELCQASTLAGAARYLDERIDAVVVDRRALGDLGPDCQCLLAAAHRRPVVLLISEDDRISLDLALRTGASGFYYHDQVDASFVRRLRKLARAYRPSLQ
jgi:DNA-binding NarL/FixJ family response regulator